MEVTAGQALTILVSLVTYFAFKWWKNPIRQIPGPVGLPLLGNILSIDIQNMHTQLYEIAQKYGSVTKIYIFNTPIVVLNTTDVCLEAMIRRGTDFLGRPFLPRIVMLNPLNLAGMTYEHTDYLMMRRVATKGLKSYGPGVQALEKIMEETVAEVIDLLQEKCREPVDTHELANGYICCVLASVLFGERYAYDDPICKSLHEMNLSFIKAADPLSSAAIFDLFPSLCKLKFLFKPIHDKITQTHEMIDQTVQAQIDEAKATFDSKNKRGCLDQLIEAAKDENHAFHDGHVKGLMLDFVVGGMESSLNSLSQAFLDLLHDPQLQKKLQAEIDSQFEPTHFIAMADRERLPLMSAYVHENLRYTSVTPFLVPHSTIRDTEVAGYKIPANTRVLINAYSTAHNPEVYPEPFNVKPERFLDADGKLVEAGHPCRYNFIGFGAGRRVCPGELLAKSRIFLFLANILQKFSIEPVGELPSRDVRDYKMSILLTPPPVTARFYRRQ